MTAFKTTESPFKSNNTASNMCGFTLMNNQVGVVVAQVMSTESNVKVTHLPSMIRVDAVGPRKRFGVDQPIAEPDGDRSHRIARPRIAAGHQPIDDVRRDAAAQPSQVLRGGSALAIVHAKADDHVRR